MSQFPPQYIFVVNAQKTSYNKTTTRTKWMQGKLIKEFYIEIACFSVPLSFLALTARLK